MVRHILSLMPRVALVTCAAFPGLCGEEAEILPRLQRLGLEARAVVWSDPDVAWKDFDLVVLRSTWDYFERFPAFEAWLARLERDRVPLQNPLPLVRWNIDQRSLGELQARGVRIVPTRFLDQGAAVDLAALLQEQRWGEAVLKPAVSGNAYRTVRIAPGQGARHQQALETVLQHGAALVQPFVPEVLTAGELSLFFFEGAFSHAVRKVPAEGDFRVQESYGSTVSRVHPQPALIAQAEAILAALPLPPLYVRIDGIPLAEGLALMEVEAIEPSLFLSYAPEALDRYVAAVARAARR